MSMDELRYTLDSVNDWLKFAEAKNAVVVATSGFALWASVRLILTSETGYYVGAYFTALSVFLVGGFVAALLSFIPVLNYRWIFPTSSRVANKNLLYFGYLATLSKKQVIESYVSATESKETDVTEIHRMYAEQVIINSRIALLKYAMFELAIKSLLFGILTPIIAIPMLYFSKIKRENTNDI